MILKSLQITNFRCFESASIDFHDKLTVLHAENGAGKTAVLDAAAIALYPVVHCHTDWHFEEDGPYPVEIAGTSGTAGNAGTSGTAGNAGTSGTAGTSASDHQRSPRVGRVSLLRRDVRLKSDTSTITAAVGTRENKECEWTQSLVIKGLRGGLWRNTKSYIEISNYLNRQRLGETRDHAALTLYYRSHRALRGLANPRAFELVIFEPGHAFEGALDASAGFQVIQHWFYQVENEELREKGKLRDFDYQDPRLKAIREAIQAMIPEATQMGFEAGMNGLSLAWKASNQDEPGRLFLDQLSDGYRTLLALVMDLAVRLVIANPGLEKPLDAECVVMVDEIDLHLHPSWQQRIIPDLMRTFPGVQWILTTHSSEVISTVRPESLRVLHEGKIEEQKGVHSYGVQSNRVLDKVMGVAARPEIPELEEMKEELMAAFQDPNNLPQLDSPLLKKLANILGDEDPFIINLKADILKPNRKSS